MIALLAALALACTEPDGGTCAQKVCVGPYNATMPWAGGADAGMYTSCFEQFQGQPEVACVSFTKYIGACSNFGRSAYNATTGTGGCYVMNHGGHRGMLWCDDDSLAAAADDQATIGAPGYVFKRVLAYEHVVPARTLTCTPQSDGGCFTDSAPRGSSIRFTCPGSGICTWAPGHEYLDNTWFDVHDGMQTCIRNVSEYPLLVRDVDGAVELDGDEDWLGGRWAQLCLERVGDRWVEKSRKAP